MLVSNVDWSDYVGRIRIERSYPKKQGWGPDLATEGETSPIEASFWVFEYSALVTNDAVEGIAGTLWGLPVLKS